MPKFFFSLFIPNHTHCLSFVRTPCGMKLEKKFFHLNLSSKCWPYMLGTKTNLETEIWADRLKFALQAWLGCYLAGRLLWYVQKLEGWGHSPLDWSHPWLHEPWQVTPRPSGSVVLPVWGQFCLHYMHCNPSVCNLASGLLWPLWVILTFQQEKSG